MPIEHGHTGRGDKISPIAPITFPRSRVRASEGGRETGSAVWDVRRLPSSMNDGFLPPGCGLRTLR